MRNISLLVWHCSATPEGRPVSVETIRQWHKARGWSDIGYHYVVHLDGKVEEGRPISKIGAHVKGHNTGSVGCVYVGGVDNNLQAEPQGHTHRGSEESYDQAHRRAGQEVRHHAHCRSQRVLLQSLSFVQCP